MSEAVVDGKRCAKCKFVKVKSEFGLDNLRLDKLKPYCKICRNNESDKKKDQDRKKQWYLENRELTINRSKIRHKEKRFERNAYLRQYYKKNPHIYTWRSLVYRVIKNKSKDGDTLKLLGYTYDEFKTHITNLFTDGMSWDNYGEWHVDHKRPLSKFDKSTPVNVVNALSNLQPLWRTTREINGIIYEGNLNKIDNYDEN